MGAISQPKRDFYEVASRSVFFQLWSAGSRAKGRKNASSRCSSQHSLTNKMKLIAEESGSLILKIHNRKRMENFKHEVTGLICISKSVYSWHNQQSSTGTQSGSTQACCGQSVCIKRAWVCHLLEHGSSRSSANNCVGQ